MRPALYARETYEYEQPKWLETPASMRPALYARETSDEITFTVGRRRGFNEARALCAGNWLFRFRPSRRPLRFNEARALCAGNLATPVRVLSPS